MTLNDQQKRFCEEYLIDMNAAQAAVRSGYNVEYGRQLLALSYVQDYISELKEARSKRTQVTSDMVVKELAKIGFANIQDYITSENAIKDISKIKRGKAAAVSSIKRTRRAFTNEEGQEITTEVVEFRLHDKISALTKLGDHLGTWKTLGSGSNKLIIAFEDPLNGD